MSVPSVAAVLVNYNAGGELARALRSIADEMGRQPWEAVVVDNASVDGSAATVAGFAPMVRLIQNAENVGFCARCQPGPRGVHGADRAHHEPRLPPRRRRRRGAARRARRRTPSARSPARAS